MLNTFIKQNISPLWHAHMKKRTLYTELLVFSGLALGISIGTILTKAHLTKPVSSHKVLQDVKDYLNADGAVEGAWIELKTINVERYNHIQNVYYGGVSRMENNKLVQYEFYANPINGDIITIYEV